MSQSQRELGVLVSGAEGVCDPFPCEQDTLCLCPGRLAVLTAAHVVADTRYLQAWAIFADTSHVILEVGWVALASPE